MRTFLMATTVLLSAMPVHAKAPARTASHKPATTLSTINVTPADAATIKRAIAAQKGHVVVVNFWATWCDPCLAEFPDLVKFAHEYGQRGVVVMSVSADMRKDIDTKVRPFLTQKGADFRNFLQQSKDPEDFINAFDPQWEGDLPRTFIYDKDGKLVKELSGAQSMKAFAAAVEPLLATSSVHR